MTKDELEELKLCLASNILPEKGGMFNIIINILTKSSDTLYEADRFKEIFSPFLLCRYLSMRVDLFPIAEYLSTVFSTAKLSNIDFYKLAYQLVPKQNNIFIRYLKKQKNDKSAIDEEIINNKNDIRSNLMEL